MVDNYPLEILMTARPPFCQKHLKTEQNGYHFVWTLNVVPFEVFGIQAPTVVWFSNG